MKKAKVDLFVGSDLIHTWIAIDGKTLPCRNIEMKMNLDRTIFILTHVFNPDGTVTEESIEHPFIEVIEASPLVIAKNFDEMPKIAVWE